MAGNAFPVSGAGAGLQQAFGSHGVTLSAKSVYPQGIDPGSFGSGSKVFDSDYNGASVNFDHSGDYSKSSSLNIAFYFGGGVLVSAASAGDNTTFGFAEVENTARSVWAQGFDTYLPSSPKMWHYVEGGGGSVEFSFSEPYIKQTPLNIPFYFGGRLSVAGVGAGDQSGFSAGAKVEIGALAIRAESIAPPTNQLATPRIGETGDITFEFDTEYEPASPFNVPFYFGGQLAVTATAGDVGSFGYGSIENTARQLQPHGWSSSDLGARGRVFDSEANGANVDFIFSGGYTSKPPAQNVPFYFSGLLNPWITGFDASGFGTHWISDLNPNISPEGFDSSQVGAPRLDKTARVVYAQGFTHLALGRPTAYNLLQFIRATGYSASSYGQAQLYGGVKYVYPNGIHASLYGRPVVVNTTADQSISRAGQIPPPSIGKPDVSPRSIFPYGIAGWSFGTAFVQRTPAPYGFDSMVMGYPAIEFWTKIVGTEGIYAGEFGYPHVYDPTQKVLPSSVVRSTVFGDVRIINQSRFIRVDGEDHLQVSVWATVESNLRSLYPKGLQATLYGDTEIRNRWPTVAPFGFDAFRPSSETETGIGYALRYIRPAGIYRTVLGSPTVTKTPEILPKGFAGASGTPTVWFRVRRPEFQGWDSFASRDHTVWFRYRHVEPTGIAATGYGKPSFEHSIRWLEPLGSSFMGLGRPAIEVRNRIISPEGIFEDFATGHMVGTDRWLNPVGFDAARFGTRIIPEIQTLYPLGFTGMYGWPTVWNETQLVEPDGYLTVGQQPADRWGWQHVFNSDQYVTQFFDSGSGLVPPAWPQWTLIENRNKVLRTSGGSMLSFGTQHIYNAARLLLPAGIVSPEHPEYYKAGMVAYRVRHLPVEGMEAPYISTWGVVYNAAFVASPAGMVATEYGMANLENTRRYFPYIGGVDMSAYGTPMVADRIRSLEIESRYSIAPPIIRMPEVKLYTRYVEPEGKDMFSQGWASLSIHWTIIRPGWTHQDLFGWAEARNLTPEIRTRGRNTEEFGDTFVRLEWRPVHAHGSETTRFGLTYIADRDRTIPVAGIRSGTVSNLLKVIRMGAPPYSEQIVSLRGTRLEDGADKDDGHGIPPPGTPQYPQVPKPIMNQQVIYVIQDDDSTLFGVADVDANSIRVEPGIWEYLMNDNHMVSLKIRYVEADEFPEKEVFEPEPARIDPHTIWAVKEAPQQAKDNHPYQRLHYVDERPPPSSGWVKGVGSPAVTLYDRSIRPSGFSNIHMNREMVGRPTAHNARTYVEPEGISSLRFGWHTVPGPQDIVQFDSEEHALYGKPTVSRPPYVGPQELKPRGLVATVWGQNEVQLLNRTIYPAGYEATLMGTRKNGDSPYMWQGLRVGPNIPFVAGGFETEHHGEPWVSFRVRELGIEGFDAFLSEYDLEAFDKRMKVIRVDQPAGKDYIEPQGSVNDIFGAVDVRAGVHYILPDGNAETYRKGAHHA